METNLKKTTSTFSQLLNLYWLRPETALWRELDIRAMCDFKVVSPSLDLGSGDGIFSFVRANGQINNKYDVFQNISINGYFDNKDVYDHDENEIKNFDIISKTNYSFDYGLDLKKSLLNKSEKLGIYKNLIEGNILNKLPFESSSFNSIFSNILYWIPDINFVLSEINRVLKPNGTLCIMLPDKQFAEYSFYNTHYFKNKNQNWKFLKYIDRGRHSSNIKQLKHENEWIELLTKFNFEIISHNKHLRMPASRIWDIGLRPIFPILHKMVNLIDEKNKFEIKNEWIELCKLFLNPILEIDKNDTSKPAFHCFIIKKNN